MSNFSFSHSVFYLLGELSASFIKFEIAVCKPCQFGSLKFVVRERVKISILPSKNMGIIVKMFNQSMGLLLKKK